MDASQASMDDEASQTPPPVGLRFDRYTCPRVGRYLTNFWPKYDRCMTPVLTRSIETPLDSGLTQYLTAV